MSGCAGGCIPENETVQSFDEQLDRLKKAAGAGSDTALACFLGITQGSMSGAKAKKKIPPAWFFQIAEQTGASVDFLYSGKAENSLQREQSAPHASGCPGCAALGQALLHEQQERRALSRENGALLRENGELKGQLKALRERL